MTVPSKTEQAKERARDGLDTQELANLLYDLPGVYEILLDGANEDWRPTQITVGFESYRASDDVAEIMAIAGWRVDRVVFQYHRIEFVQRGAGGDPA